jgi:hypothetical protein
VIFAVAIFLVAAVLLIWLAYRAENAMQAACAAVAINFEARLRDAEEAEEKRRLAVHKMAKTNERRAAQSDAEVRKLAKQTAALRDEAIGLQQRMDTRGE